MENEKKQIIEKALEGAMSYIEYREKIDSLMAIGKTTGPNQSEDMIHYTELNIGRMNKWDKHLKLNDELEGQLSLLQDEIWLVITEGWCGDAAHNVPVLAALSELNPTIDLKLVLRDENLELMDLYLTNGGRSIPKLIRLKKGTLEELGEWGPRPEEAREIVMKAKEAGEDYNTKVQVWYARDKGKTMQKELLEQFAVESL